MSIRAIKNHILFTFIDELNSVGWFKEGESKGGIALLANHSDSAGKSRWANIVSLGPDCTSELKPEHQILIENLQWTDGVNYKPDGITNQKIWRTDDSKILAYR